MRDAASAVLGFRTNHSHHHFGFLLCLGLWLLMGASISANAATPPALSNPNATPEAHLGPEFHGVMRGSASVGSTGNASYIIPIDVPPGTNGISPSLSLNYHSGVNNGFLGVGWFVQGLTSKINRCPKTIAQDGLRAGIGLNGNDRFCLDGHRLMAVSGTYGTPGTEYRTESDEFSRITGYGGTQGNPDYWVVERKDGMTTTYGGTADAKLQAPGSAYNVVWCLSRKEDELGNYFTFSYTRTTTITSASDSYLRPDRIDYTGNANAGLSPYASVRFDYENRPDHTLEYSLNGPISTTQRLTNIKTYVGSGLVKDLQLTYETSTSTERSRLASLKTCSASGACTENTDLDWSDSGVGLVSPYTNVNSFLQAPVLLGDFNGDGLTDLIKYSSSYDQTVYVYHGRPQGGFTYKQARFWSPSGPRNLIGGDFNGDGRQDVLIQHKTGSNVGIRIYLAKADGTFDQSTSAAHQFILPGHLGLADWSAAGFRILVSDINGDGKDDLMLRPATSPTLGTHTLLADANGQFTSVHQSNAFPGISPEHGHRAILSDFNGDGHPDVLFRWQEPSAGNWIYLADENGQYSSGTQLDASGSALSLIWTGKSNPVLGDYNGDGRTDMFLQSWTGDSHVILADEQGQFTDAGVVQTLAESYLNLGWNGIAHTAYAADINGDGRSDLFILDRSGTNNPGTSYVMRSDTEGRFTQVTQSWNSIGSNVLWKDAYVSPHLSDFNGDGRADLFSPGGYNSGTSYSSPFMVYFHEGQDFPDQLTQVTDGLGAQTQFSYKPLTDTSVHTPGSGSVYPEQDTVSARYVVSQHSQSNGIGGMNSTDYTYEGVKRHVTGRGDFGFQKMTAINTTTDSKVVTEYEQGFPFSKMANKVEVYRNSDSRLLGSTETTYAGHGNLTNGPIFPYVDTRIEKAFELSDGRLLSTTQTTNHCDAYGNITDTTVLLTDHENNSTHQSKTISTFNIDVTNWRVGQKLTKELQNSLNGQNDSSLDISTNYVYSAATGRVSSMTRESGSGAPLELTTGYTYDAFGNTLSQTLSGPGITTRTSSSQYDSQGRFPVSVTNMLGHTEARSYDAHYGLILSQTGPNGLTTSWTYNDMGRLLTETRPDGTQTQSALHKGTGGGSAQAVYYAQTLASGSPPARQFFDKLGRAVSARSQIFDGSYVNVVTEYDDRGRTKRSSEPMSDGGSPVWNTPIYDHLNRPLSLDAADDANDTITTYSGFSVALTQAGGRTTKSTSNAAGQVILTEDHLGTQTTFVYNQNGQRIQVNAGVNTAEASTVTYTLDKLGRQLSQNDPDHGISTYTYDAFGQVLTEQTAKMAAANQTRTFQYDLLGRITSRTEPEGTTTWTYDNSASGNLGLGKLHSESQPGYSKTYQYQAHGDGKPTGAVTQIGNQSFATGQTYNASGQADTMTYPSTSQYPGGLQVQTQYNALGYLERVHSPTTGEVFYQYLQSNHRGQLTQQWLGDGSTLTQSYEAHSARVLDQNTPGVQRFQYQWDLNGNLTQRDDLVNNLSESFTYDELDRLTDAQVGGQTQINYGFSAMGNLTQKSDIGNLAYNATQPHAINQLSQNGQTDTYTYDANGNLSGSSDLPSLTWASYNKPTQIQKSGIQYDFSYGPDRARYRKMHAPATGNTTTTHYVDGAIEQTTDGSQTTTKHLIRAGSVVIAVHTSDNSSASTTYLHRDHLSSITARTDANGQITERLSFGPWGERRNATDWNTAVSTASDPRGYTGHEHLDDLNLIHMNGRVYSAKLGRMLSPDPETQAPEDGQNYNRYAYVFNNPLKNIDPSGYVSVGIQVCLGANTACRGNGGGFRWGGIGWSERDQMIFGEGPIRIVVNGPNDLAVFNGSVQIFDTPQEQSEENGGNAEDVPDTDEDMTDNQISIELVGEESEPNVSYADRFILHSNSDAIKVRYRAIINQYLATEAGSSLANSYFSGSDVVVDVYLRANGENRGSSTTPTMTLNYLDRGLFQMVSRAEGENTWVRQGGLRSFAHEAFHVLAMSNNQSRAVSHENLVMAQHSPDTAGVRLSTHHGDQRSLNVIQRSNPTLLD